MGYHVFQRLKTVFRSRPPEELVMHSQVSCQLPDQSDMTGTLTNRKKARRKDPMESKGSANQANGNVTSAPIAGSVGNGDIVRV